MDELSPVDAKVLEERARIALLGEIAAGVIDLLAGHGRQARIIAASRAWTNALLARDEAEARARERWHKARGLDQPK